MIPTKRVLLVDDDEDFRASLSALLATEGFEVDVARSGSEGLGKLEVFHPDAIVLDVMMTYPDEGYAINEAVHFDDRYEAFRSVPILMVSSIQESPDERFPRAEELPGIRPDWYFTKPLDIPRFLSTLRRAVRA